MFTIGPFSLTPEEVERRKRYLEITPDDERRLREAHPHLQTHAQAIIDRFYEYLLGHETTRNMLSAPGLVDRLKQLQTRYFLELTSGRYDLAYFENRLRVGQAHQRIGLSPEWYLGAYLKYLHIVSDLLSSSFGQGSERFYQTMVSLTKVIYLDMGLTLDAYHYSHQAARRQLTDMIVHDLQNPLAGIVAALQILGSKGEGLTGGEREAIREAIRRCDDLSQMISNVLQVSRAEQGKLETYVENVDLAALVRDVSQTLRLQAAGRTIEVDVPASATVRTDQTLVRRILQNLIRNAFRHTPAGTRVTVRVEAPAGGRVRLSVSDDGAGIPVEIQDRLFEPFGAAALRASGVRVDIGLGLPSCRVAAQALGADLAVRSDGKRGTTFVVTFPP